MKISIVYFFSVISLLSIDCILNAQVKKPDNFHHLHYNNFKSNTNSTNQSFPSEKPDSCVYYTFLTNKDSIPNTKVVYNWNQDGKVKMEAYYLWDDIRKKWRGNFREDREWNQCGKNTVYTCFEWDIFQNNWKGKFKSNFEYDDYGNLSTQYISNWDTIKNVWFLYQKIVFNRDSSEVFFETTYQKDNISNFWFVISENRFEIFINQFDSTSICSHWDYDLSTWIKDKKYSNFDDGRLYVDTTKSWNEQLSEWILYDVYSEISDDKGNLIEQCYQSWYNGYYASKIEYKNFEGKLHKLQFGYLWNVSNNRWDYWDKVEYEYDEKGNLILELHYMFRNSIWEVANKTACSYDDVKKLNCTIFYDFNEDNNWVVRNKSYEYFPINTISNNDIPKCVINLYPNISNSLIYIELEVKNNMIIYDLNGKPVLSKSLEKGLNTIDLTFLKAGLYIIHLFNDSLNFEAKIIKK
ncbi:MAG TPA: T9SS type A sorting domain-containing protein [Bacteroidales bacterium]|nr:T9SS type A sorting domain-containing protein [Bacteroidales bacterium]